MPARNRTIVAAAAAVVILILLVVGSRTGLLSTFGRVEPVFIAGEQPACADCSLVPTLVATMTSPTSQVTPEAIPTVLRDSRGMHYLVYNGWIEKPVRRYDASGKFLGILGDTGRGPAKYEMTHTVFIGAGDSVFVYDWEREFLVFDREGKFVRTIPLSHGTPFAYDPNAGGTLYAMGAPRSKTKARSPYLLRVDAKGEIRDSFPIFSGAEIPDPLPAMAPNGDLWTYMQENYRLERHSPDGEVQQIIGVTVPGRARPFLTHEEEDSLVAVKAGQHKHPERPMPPPRMSAIVDSTGLLWVARSYPKPFWDTVTVVPDPHSPFEPAHEVSITVDQRDGAYITAVEVIDPRTGQLLARTEFPFFAMFPAPGYVARVALDANGLHRTEVYKVDLRRGAGAAAPANR
jgi:hypothetical protein